MAQVRVSASALCNLPVIADDTAVFSVSPGLGAQAAIPFFGGLEALLGAEVDTLRILGTVSPDIAAKYDTAFPLAYTGLGYSLPMGSAWALRAAGTVGIFGIAEYGPYLFVGGEFAGAWRLGKNLAAEAFVGLRRYDTIMLPLATGLRVSYSFAD